MEGPIPIWEKLFKNMRICDLSVVNEQDEINYGELLYYKFHNKYIDTFNEFDKD